jgi:hypothetical protein
LLLDTTLDVDNLASNSSNYWVSFNDSNEDTLFEIISTSAAANFFFGQKLVLTMLSNHFEELGLEDIKKK